MVGRSPRAFTLIELLVVVAIISVLLMILVPSLKRARRLAAIATCAVNMKGSLVALHVYGADWDDFVWNYGPEVHDHYSPDEAKDNHHLWYAKLGQPDVYHWHVLTEGRPQHSYWRGRLIVGGYASAGVLGCSVSPPGPWWYVSSNLNEVEPSNCPSIRQNPPFVYRGRAVSVDLDVDVYVGGNIAATGWSPGNEAPGQETVHRPSPKLSRPSEVLLNCPVFYLHLSGGSDNAQVQPHQSNMGRWKLWSEMAGYGYLGHIVAENVGWVDGHVQFADSGGEKFRYVRPDTGEIIGTYFLP